MDDFWFPGKVKVAKSSKVFSISSGLKKLVPNFGAQQKVPRNERNKLSTFKLFEFWCFFSMFFWEYIAVCFFVSFDFDLFFFSSRERM